MGTSTPPTTRLYFGPFELDPHTGELWKSGRPVKLPPQPTKLLIFLASRCGELVTREEIKESLWGADTFVDFEQGLNFCIKKIRFALGDNPDQPEFIQTLPRRGYRFIGSARTAAYQSAYQKSGVRGYWQKELEAAERSKSVNPCWMSRVYAHLGKKEQMLEFLNRSSQQHCSGPHTVIADPINDPFRDDPRFRDVVARLRLKRD